MQRSIFLILPVLVGFWGLCTPQATTTTTTTTTTPPTTTTTTHTTTTTTAPVTTAYDVEFCQRDYSCKDTNRTCFDGRCLCNPGYYEFGDGTNCTQRINAGETCDERLNVTFQCNDYPFAVCLGHKCTCNETHYYVNGSTCSERIKDGRHCNKSNSSDPHQCIDHATCNATLELCLCDETHYDFGGECVQRHNISQTCDMAILDGRQCVENAHCVNETTGCACDDHYYAATNKSMCINSIQLNDTCELSNKDPQQCDGQFAVCTNVSSGDRCVCDENHYMNQSNSKSQLVCENRIAPGMPCDTKNEDYEKQCVENAHCSHFEDTKFDVYTSTCVCEFNYIAEKGKCVEFHETKLPTGQSPVTHPATHLIPTHMPGGPLPPIDELIG